MFGIATLGGIIMILGAYFIYKGEIFKSVITYMFADIVWIIMGFAAGDYVGVVFIAIGALLGLVAFLKMRSGEYDKSINKNK